MHQNNNIQQTYKDIFKSKVENVVNKAPFVLLNKVLKNIIENPKEKKFHTIKKSEKISNLLTEDVIFLLEKSGFKNNSDSLVFQEENYPQLHRTYIEITSFSQPHQQLFQQDVMSRWSEISTKADKLLAENEEERSFLFYQQALELVVGEFKKGYEFYAIPCCTACISIGKFHEKVQNLMKGIEIYEQAVKYVPQELIDSLTDTSVLLIPMTAYFSLGSILLLLPEPTKLFEKVEQLLKVSYSIAERIEDRNHLAKVSNVLKLISYQKKDFNNFAFWDKKSKEFENSQVSKDTYVNRLMIIEQNMKGNPKKYIQKLIELAEESEIVFPEFSGSLYGQIIYHHRQHKELDIQNGIEYGMKGLAIMMKIHGEKNTIVRNIYLSLSDIYNRLGDTSKSMQYQMKQYNAEVLLGLREDENNY
eukprot:gene5571-9387_t